MKAHSLRQVCVNSIQPTRVWERILYPPSKELVSRGTVEQGQDGDTEHPPPRLGPALKRDTTMAVFVSLCAFAGQSEQRVKDNSTQKPEKRKRTHGTKDAVPSERGHSEDRETSEQRFSDNAASVAPAQ